MTNPYIWRTKIAPESDMFFGRQREMRRIMDMLSVTSPQSVSIVGERRIGKSSLAYRVYHQINQQQDTLAVYLDCDELHKDCNSVTAFYQLLGSCFKEAVNVEMGQKSQFNRSNEVPFTDYRGFKQFVANVSKLNFKVVLFLDEFEHLPEKPFSDDSFFSNLRAFADKPEFAFAFVTISRTDIKELTHRAIQSSSFYNIFERVPIGLLDHDSIKALRYRGFNEDSGNTLTGQELEKLNYYAGYFPFFNQVACGFLWDAKQDSEIPDWDDLEVKLLPDYDTLWNNRTHDEQLLLKSLQEDNKRTNMKLKQLKVRGVAKKVDKIYSPFSDFFTHLITERFESKYTGGLL